MRVGLAPAAERWRYRFLLALAALLLLGQPILQDTVAATGIVTRSASVARPLKLATPLAWLALHLLAKATGSPVVGGLAFLAALWLAGQTLWLTVEALVRERKADGDALAGAGFGYFMLALTWAQLYAAALALDPGAISVPGEAPLGSDIVYFSLVTVTTLGYGDVLPISPMARILAATEAVVGALYVAVLIGRIVSDLKPGGGDLVPAQRRRQRHAVEREKRHEPRHPDLGGQRSEGHPPGERQRQRGHHRQRQRRLAMHQRHGMHPRRRDPPRRRPRQPGQRVPDRVRHPRLPQHRGAGEQHRHRRHPPVRGQPQVQRQHHQRRQRRAEHDRNFGGGRLRGLGDVLLRLRVGWPGSTAPATARSPPPPRSRRRTAPPPRWSWSAPSPPAAGSSDASPRRSTTGRAPPSPADRPRGSRR